MYNKTCQITVDLLCSFVGCLLRWQSEIDSPCILKSYCTILSTAGTLLRSWNLVTLHTRTLHSFFFKQLLILYILILWWTLPNSLLMPSFILTLRRGECPFLYMVANGVLSSPLIICVTTYVTLKRHVWLCAWWLGNMDVFWHACKLSVIPFVFSFRLFRCLYGQYTAFGVGFILSLVLPMIHSAYVSVVLFHCKILLKD